MRAVLGKSWDGAGVRCGVGLGQMESLPHLHRQVCSKGRCLWCPLPKSQPFAGLWGSGVPCGR